MNICTLKAFPQAGCVFLVFFPMPNNGAQLGRDTTRRCAVQICRDKPHPFTCIMVLPAAARSKAVLVARAVASSNNRRLDPRCKFTSTIFSFLHVPLAQPGHEPRALPSYNCFISGKLPDSS